MCTLPAVMLDWENLICFCMTGKPDLLLHDWPITHENMYVQTLRKQVIDWVSQQVVCTIYTNRGHYTSSIVWIWIVIIVQY